QPFEDRLAQVRCHGGERRTHIRRKQPAPARACVRPRTRAQCGPMSYDPFARGPYPVGVRTLSATDASRAQRFLPIEVWYPATDAFAGRDLDAATKDHFELLPGF